MRKKLLILLCSVLLGLGITGCMVIPAAQTIPLAEEPARTVAWWSLMYEMPNPEGLPVKVRFQWLKGLESQTKNDYNNL